jgi:hypothetical protein
MKNMECLLFSKLMDCYVSWYGNTWIELSVFMKIDGFAIFKDANPNIVMAKRTFTNIRPFFVRVKTV